MSQWLATTPSWLPRNNKKRDRDKKASPRTTTTTTSEAPKTSNNGSVPSASNKKKRHRTEHSLFVESPPQEGSLLSLFSPPSTTAHHHHHEQQQKYPSTAQHHLQQQQQIQQRGQTISKQRSPQQYQIQSSLLSTPESDNDDDHDHTSHDRRDRRRSRQQQQPLHVTDDMTQQKQQHQQYRFPDHSIAFPTISEGRKNSNQSPPRGKKKTKCSNSSTATEATSLRGYSSSLFAAGDENQRRRKQPRTIPAAAAVGHVRGDSHRMTPLVPQPRRRTVAAAMSVLEHECPQPGDANYKWQYRPAARSVATPPKASLLPVADNSYINGGEGGGGQPIHPNTIKHSAQIVILEGKKAIRELMNHHVQQHHDASLDAADWSIVVMDRFVQQLSNRLRRTLRSTLLSPILVESSGMKTKKKTASTKNKSYAYKPITAKSDAAAAANNTNVFQSLPERNRLRHRELVQMRLDDEAIQVETQHLQDLLHSETRKQYRLQQRCHQLATQRQTTDQHALLFAHVLKGSISSTSGNDLHRSNDFLQTTKDDLAPSTKSGKWVTEPGSAVRVRKFLPAPPGTLGRIVANAAASIGTQQSTIQTS